MNNSDGSPLDLDLRGLSKLALVGLQERIEVYIEILQEENFLKLDLPNFRNKFSDEFFENLPSLLPEGAETHYIEFKQELPRKNSKILKEIIGFANGDSGVIVIGITNNGEIKGIRDIDKTKQRINHIARECKPSLRVKIRPVKCKDGKILLLILIPKTKKVIQAPNGKCYERIGNDTQILEINELSGLNRRKKVGKLGFLFINDLEHYLKEFMGVNS